MHSGELAVRIGDNVSLHRRLRGMSMGELATRAGVSKSLLSRIERGEGNPSIETLWRLAQAFDLPLGVLLGEPSAPQARRIPARSGARVRAERDAMDGWLLHADGQGKRSEIYEIEMPAHADRESEGHPPGTEEVVFCISGGLEVGPVGAEVEIGAGDAAWFVAATPHRYAAGPDGARVIDLLLYPLSGVS